jgi:hypothetical protein
MSKTIFVKVSGDLFTAPAFLEKVRELARGNFTVICVGGGTQINKAFQKVGILSRTHGPLGREMKTMREKVLAKEVLNRNADELKFLLHRMGIEAQVIVPILETGPKEKPLICHVNGDQYVRTLYLGFDQLFVFTTLDRVSKKVQEFSGLPKVKIVGI